MNATIFRMTRAGWRQAAFPLLGLCAGLVGAQAVTEIATPRYEASASILITAPGGTQVAGREVPDLTLAQNYTPTIARLLGSRQVATDTAAALGISPELTVGRISGSFEPGTQIVTAKATARSADLAADIANASTGVMGPQLSRLEIGGPVGIGTRPIDVATAPPQPAYPNPFLNRVLGGMIGLLAGLAFARFRDRVDDRLWKLSQVEDGLLLPVLGVLPRLGHRFARQSARQLSGQRAVADAVSGTVAALSVLTAPQGRTRLLVTSAHRQDGKALVTALLATGFANQRSRVAVVEAEPGESALTRWLPEAARFRAPHESGDPAARVELPAGIPDPIILTLEPDGHGPSARAVGRFVDQVADGANVVLVHAPPVLAGGDLASLAAHADGVLLVVWTGETRTAHARRAAQLVHRLGLPLAGVVAINPSGELTGWRHSGVPAVPAGRPVSLAQRSGQRRGR